MDGHVRLAYNPSMKRAVYAGSFDPITNGHLEIVERALSLFDEIVILVAVNPSKKYRFSLEERTLMVRSAIEEAGIKGVSVDHYDGLTVKYALTHGIHHLVRGLRSADEFEYEYQLAFTNHIIDQNIETVFFLADRKDAFLSSTIVMELYAYGSDISSLVPPSVLRHLSGK